MNEQQRQRLSAQLRDVRVGLLSQMALEREGVDLGGRAQMAAAHFGDPQDSHAQLISEKDIEFAVAERDAAELNAVEAAITRIAADTYGQCTDCGEAIAFARLQASPEAARCMPCQISFERHLPPH